MNGTFVCCYHHWWRHTDINPFYLCLRACLFPFHFSFFDQCAHLFAEKNTIPMMLMRQSKYSCLILSSIYHPQQLAYMTALPFSWITAFTAIRQQRIRDPSLKWVTRIVKMDCMAHIHWLPRLNLANQSHKLAAYIWVFLFRLSGSLRWCHPLSIQDTHLIWILNDSSHLWNSSYQFQQAISLWPHQTTLSSWCNSCMCLRQK